MIIVHLVPKGENLNCLIYGKVMGFGKVTKQEIDVVLVGPITYPIVRKEDLNDDGKMLDGWVQYRPYSISVDANLGEQGERIVIWHEVLHAILVHAGFKHTDEHESVIEALSYGIVQVLQNNQGM